MIRGASPVWSIAVSVLFVAAVLGALIYFDAHEQVLQLLDWLDAQGAWGPLLFILVMALVVVLVLPGVLFTTGAGFVFGVVEGTLYVVLGTPLGAALAFLIARHLFGARAARFVLAHARLKLVGEELAPQGWKIVLLTRLVPFFPFKLSNYFFGLTRFSLRGFVSGTFVGIIPFSLHNVYLGSIAADIATLGARSAERTPLEWALYGAGFLATVALLIYLNLVPDRRLEAAKGLLETLSPAQRDGVKAVAMDMWPAFMSAARACIPQADIVHDRFHVAKYLGDAVDAVRKQEHRCLSQAGGSPLTGSKWAWQKTCADGRSSEAVAFRALNQLNLKTSRAWRIKETFKEFWRYRYTGAAKRFFVAWSNNAMRSRLEPVKKVVRMLRRHETGLLNYSRHRISNACAEGFNSAIQLIKANARGFRNFTNYRARILFHCGKLDMHLG